MKTIRGKYGEAKIFTHNVDDMTIEQVTGMLNENIAVDGNVRIMPDCHAGKGSVIGTTMRIHDKVVPNLVGVDIGCGMLCTQIIRNETAGIDYDKLDAAIQALVPSGMSVRNQPHRLSEQIPFDQVLAPFNETRARLSIGTLGGGNHFHRTEYGRGKQSVSRHSFRQPEPRENDCRTLSKAGGSVTIHRRYGVGRRIAERTGTGAGHSNDVGRVEESVQ